MRFSCTIKGIDAIRRRFANSTAIIDKTVDSTLEQGAEMIRADAKANLEKYSFTMMSTGNLKEHIDVERRGGVWYVIAKSKYAAYVEWGTGSMGDPSVPHTAKERWVYFNSYLGHCVTTHGMQARPYMMPAVRSNIPLINQRMRRNIQDALTKG